MDISEVLSGLRGQAGTVDAQLMSDGLFSRILAEESTVVGAGGTMPVRNVGIEECSERDHRFCIFLRPGGIDSQRGPGTHTMIMRDGQGRVVGYDIPRDEIPMWRSRTDVIFLSDDFVMFSDAITYGQVTMEIHSRPYRGEGDWIPESCRSIIWFPCSTSSLILGESYGVTVGTVSAAIVAMDL